MSSINNSSLLTANPQQANLADQQLPQPGSARRPADHSADSLYSVDSSAQNAELLAKTKKLGSNDVSDTYGVAFASRLAFPADASGSLPTLPTNKIADPAKTTRESLAALTRFPAGDEAFSIFTAMRILTETSSKLYQAQSAATVAGQTASLNAQLAGAEEALKKAQSEQKAAATSFVTNLGASAATYKMAKLGSSPSVTDQELVKRAGAVGSKENLSTSQLKDDRTKEEGKTARVKQEIEDSLSDFESASSHVSSDAIRKSEEKAKKRVMQETKEVEETRLSNSVERGSMAAPAGTERPEENLSSSTAGRDAAHRAGVYAAASGAGQLITSGGDAISQNIGYGADAKQAEVTMKFDEFQKIVADQQSESAKSNKEKAAKMIDSAIDLLKQHFEMAKSTNDRIG